MSRNSQSMEGLIPTNIQGSLQAPVGGLNSIDALSAMPPTDAVVLENFVAYPDRVEMRYGAADFSTGYSSVVKSMHVWNGFNTFKLFACTDAGVFDATTAGAVGAAVATITNGQCTSGVISTGGVTVLDLVNGTDSLQRFDGTSWATVATFGTLATNTLIAMEVYQQRYYMLQKASLSLWFLPVNSVTGTATEYPLGAIFRRGGELVSIGTWTIDGGTGPTDQLVVTTSQGEVAVFSGTDPSQLGFWSLLGVYFIGEPLGVNSLYKFGGDILYLSKAGLFPLSRALQVASVDRTVAISNKIRTLYNTYVQNYGLDTGWQLINVPDIPLLLMNIPGTDAGLQLVMHPQTGAWSTFTGWNATCFARAGGILFFGVGNKVAQAWVGASDFGSDIVATCFPAYSPLRYPKNKQVKMVRAVFRANGQFSYTIGIDNDFANSPTTSVVANSAAGNSLWGSGVWGSAIWNSSQSITREWRVVPDRPGVYKSLYFQVASHTARVAFLQADFLFARGGTF